jgi:hypothetical protein
MSSDETTTQKLGGRKATAFYASLACMMVLALMDKAHTHVLGLIDTLFLVYAGANVMAKPKTLTESQPQPTTSKEEP